MPGIISLPSHVAMTESVDVIELDQAEFFREKFATDPT